MEIDGTTYEFTRASDLERDGMSLECVRVEATGGRTLVLEAFWYDPTGRFSVWSCAEELPFALVSSFLRKVAEACMPIKSKEAGARVLVYVPLLDEGVDVWRPVAAEVIGNGCYLITGDQPSDERWKFLPGTSVRCEERRFEDGTLGLVATQQAG
jgi:hypothetical protein